MKIKINSDNRNFIIPAPLSAASMFIRMVPEKKISKEDKKTILSLLKILKKDLKSYSGLEIVNIKSASGEKIIIQV